MKPVTKEDLKNRFADGQRQLRQTRDSLVFMVGLAAGIIGGFSIGYVVSRSDTTKTVCERTCRGAEKIFLRHTVEDGCICIPPSMIED